GEAQVVDERATIKTLGNVVGLNDLATKPWSGWNLDLFKVQHPSFLGLCGHFFVAFQTGFLFGLTAFGVGTYPIELIFKTASKFGVFFALTFQTFLLCFWVSSVVTFVWV